MQLVQDEGQRATGMPCQVRGIAEPVRVVRNGQPVPRGIHGIGSSSPPIHAEQDADLVALGPESRRQWFVPLDVPDAPGRGDGRVPAQLESNGIPGWRALSRGGRDHDGDVGPLHPNYGPAARRDPGQESTGAKVGAHGALIGSDHDVGHPAKLSRGSRFRVTLQGPPATNSEPMWTPSARKWSAPGTASTYLARCSGDRLAALSPEAQ